MVLHLIQDVPTRWNSSFIMLQRLLRLKDTLLVMGDKEEYKQMLEKIRPADWQIISNVVNVLKPFAEVTENLSHASACISEVSKCILILASIDHHS